MTVVALSARAAPVYCPRGNTRAARLRDLERQARGSWLLGGPTLNYDAACWDVTDALPKCKGPAQSRTRQRLWFSATPSHHAAKPMKPVVIGFAKAYVRLGSEGLGPSAIRSRLYAVRHLGDALAEAKAKSVQDCTLATLNRALAIAQKTLGEGAALAVAVQLELLALYMGACRLTKVPVGVWRHTASLSQSPDGSSGPEFDQHASARLPTVAFLTACAKAFQISTEVCEVIVSSVLALLACAGGGSRIGEVLRVREDPQSMKGLILPGSKGAAEHERLVLASMADLVEAAISRLLEATADGRAIKRAYDEDCTRLYLPHHLTHLRGKAVLTMPEAAAILGLKPGSNFHYYVRRNCLEQVREFQGTRAAGHNLSFATVEKHILARVEEHMRLAGGRGYHPLLVVRWRQFTTATGCPCMFESFGYQTLHRSIRPVNDRTSMFQRQGLDPSGTITGTTKSIRHLLNTLAHLAGLTAEDVAEISGRNGIGHNKSYDHTPPEVPLDILDDFARHRDGSKGDRSDEG